jgi:thiamine pyrophosphate-dependent acetolactate synthase large subunit-like protein
MATPTAGDGFVETLIKWRVGTVFGLPRDGINGIIEALRARQDRIRFFQVHQEEAAAFGYANGPASRASVSRRLVPAAFTSSSAGAAVLGLRTFLRIIGGEDEI